jgi:peptide deformylase
MLKWRMVVENIIQIGNPILRKKNKLVKNVKDRKVMETIENLTDSMRHYGLVGMAAPQIGENFKLFVTEIRPTPSRKPDLFYSHKFFLQIQRPRR